MSLNASQEVQERWGGIPKPCASFGPLHDLNSPLVCPAGFSASLIAAASCFPRVCSTFRDVVMPLTQFLVKEGPCPSVSGLIALGCFEICLNSLHQASILSFTSAHLLTWKFHNIFSTSISLSKLLNKSYKCPKS